MSRDTETAFVGRANVTRRVLQRQGVDLTAAERAAVTRVVVRFGPYCLDTGEDHPIAYDSDTGVIEMQIGLMPDIEPERYTAEVTVYDAATPEGFAWGDFRLTVRAWDVCPP